MTGDTNPTTPAAVEWSAAEREAVREAIWRFERRTLEERRDAVLDALARCIAERETRHIGILAGAEPSPERRLA